MKGQVGVVWCLRYTLETFFYTLESSAEQCFSKQCTLILELD